MRKMNFKRKRDNWVYIKNYNNDGKQVWVALWGIAFCRFYHIEINKLNDNWIKKSFIFLIQLSEYIIFANMNISWDKWKLVFLQNRELQILRIQ